MAAAQKPETSTGTLTKNRFCVDLNRIQEKYDNFKKDAKSCRKRGYRNDNWSGIQKDLQKKKKYAIWKLKLPLVAIKAELSRKLKNTSDSINQSPTSKRNVHSNV